MLKIADVIKPSSEMSMIVAVMRGKLYERIDAVNPVPPTQIGSQLIMKIIMAFVGLEWVRSV